jgi:hypothetical protein
MRKKLSPRKEVLKPVTGPENTSVKQEIKFILPPGAKLSDLYMDAQDVAQELKLGKRVVYNLRRQGKLSYTTINDGKIFYIRQEIAAIMHSNMVPASNSLLASQKKRK